MKILNFGSCNIDYVYQLEHIVTDGETEQSVQMDIFPGGKGLNQSVAAARAGAPVYHAAVIGTDGGFLAEILKSNGADVSLIKTADVKNGHAVIQVNSQGENAIIVYPGTNHLIDKTYVDAVLSHFESGDLIMLQNEISEIKYIINRAHSRGMRVVLNPSPISENLENLKLSEISYLIMNELEAKRLLGGESAEQCLELAKEKIPKTAVVITLGKRGAVYQSGDKKVYQSAFKAQAVDTTAAGDTFAGYFAAGLCRNEPIESILKTASAASAIAVSRHGAAPSIPTLSEVKAAMPEMTERPGNAEDAERLKKIADYVSGNLKEATLGGLSAELNYSYYAAGNLVRRLTGMSFTEYAQQQRLEAALHMLLSSSMPISEIAAAVGYENDSFFRRKFKEKYNVTPKKCRMRKEFESEKD